MGWFGRKGRGGAGEGAPPEPPRPTSDELVAGRRDFFRLGLGRVREGGADALQAVGKAARVMQDAMEGLDAEARAASAGPRVFGPAPTPEAARMQAEAERRRGDGPLAPPPREVRGVVRPPGAVAEARFLELCTSCKECVEACPEDAIVSAVDPRRAGRAGTPLLRLQSRACALCPDVPCAAACPTGALVPVGRAEDIRIGTALVHRRLCLNGLGERCEICVDHCPLGARVMTVGEDGFPAIDAETCTGCGQCVVRCPTYPAALHVTPR